MRAFGFKEHGGPDVHQHLDVPMSAPGPGEVRVEVEACALNHLDIWVREGWPGLDLELPHVAGCDVTGIVAEVGDGVAEDLVGRPVVIQPGLWDPACPKAMRGEPTLSPTYHILGEHVRGGLAESLVVPARNIHPRPEGLSVEEAAAFPLTYLTAYRMLFTKARLRPGDRVLSVGASGGVSLHGALLAQWAGAEVVGTTRSERKAAELEKAGLETVVVTDGDDWGRDVKRALGGSADIVLENVGAATWDQALRCLGPGGRVVTCGATAGPKVGLDLRHVFWKQLEVLGSTMGTPREFDEVLTIVPEVRPVVGRTFSFDEAGAAVAHLEAAEQVGKVVVRVR